MLARRQHGGGLDMHAACWRCVTAKEGKQPLEFTGHAHIVIQPLARGRMEDVQVAAVFADDLMDALARGSKAADLKRQCVAASCYVSGAASVRWVGRYAR